MYEEKVRFYIPICPFNLLSFTSEVHTLTSFVDILPNIVYIHTSVYVVTYVMHTYRCIDLLFYFIFNLFLIAALFLKYILYTVIYSELKYII